MCRVTSGEAFRSDCFHGSTTGRLLGAGSRLRYWPTLGLLALIVGGGCSLDTRNLSVVVKPMDGEAGVRDGMPTLPDNGRSNGYEPSGSGGLGPGATCDAAVGGAAIDPAGGTALDATSANGDGSDMRGAGGSGGSGGVGWRDGGTGTNDGSGGVNTEALPIPNDASLTGEIGRSDDGLASEAPALDAFPPDKAGPDSFLADASTLEKGLVGHWRFDEGSGTKAADSSGNGITGTLVNGPTWSKSCAPAKSGGTNGSCLHFNGANQFVRMVDATVANIAGAISMTAWIKMDTTGAGSPDQGMRNIISHGYTENPNAEVMMRLGLDNYVTGSWDGREHQISSPAARDVGIWVHLASVFDGASWRLYRNGKLIAFRADNLGAVPVGQPWCIGATSAGRERFFSGLMDDVRLYNRALSAAEIADLASGTDVLVDTGGASFP